MSNYIFLSNRIFLCLVLVISLFSCSKEALIKEPTGVVTPEQLKRASQLDPSIQASNVLGLYSTMNNTGVGGTGGDDDFGQKSYDIYSDLLCGDMALGATSYGWYVSIYQLTSTVDFTQSPNYKVWRYYYRIIFAANGIIEAFATAEMEGKAAHYMAQAKTMRAYAYFYLAQFYLKDYNPSEAVLPLYTDTTKANLPQVSTENIYKQIISDCTEAIALFEAKDDAGKSFERSSKSEVNKYIAEGILAYTYAAMGDYEKTKAAAKDIIDNGGFPLMEREGALSGFNDINAGTSKSWMWGTDITLNMGIGLVSWWGQMDIYTYSYASAGTYKAIDSDLYAKIKDKDIRKSQFSNVNGDNYKLVPVGKFYHPDKKIDGQRRITTDYVYMRVEEFYLLYAESLAKTGDEAGAKEWLKKLLEKRFLPADASEYAYVDTLSGQTLLAEIYLQTRIELWGEGKSYLAMKRNKATVTRGGNHLSLVGYPILYNDPRLTFSIPQSEVQNNPNIKR